MPEFDAFESNIEPTFIYNKLEGTHNISDKKHLFLNMVSYYENLEDDILDSIPLTFLVYNGSDDESFTKFLASTKQDFINDIQKSTTSETSNSYYSDENQPKYWIIKPGENSNRGNGIQLWANVDDLKSYMRSNPRKWYIIQEYITRPMLINKRKFDIRCFGLFTSINGHKRWYFYQGGYIRTSSHEFSLDDPDDKFVHLTNDAIQTHSEDYGKYETCNKISFLDFEKYLESNYLHGSFYEKIFPKIKRLVRDTFSCAFTKIDPNLRTNGFELYGFDIMLDEDWKVYLIEANTNPCLETPWPLLSSLITSVLDNTFRLTIDLLCPPPDDYTSRPSSKPMFDALNTLNKFELILDSNYNEGLETDDI